VPLHHLARRGYSLEKFSYHKFWHVSIFGNFLYLCFSYETLIRFFETKFMEEANEFLSTLDEKMVRKVLYHIDLAEQTNDPKLFKKLQQDIWEFRTKFGGLQIRMLAFWDKTSPKRTLVIATHGFVKKVDKIPANELKRASRLRDKYFENKRKEESYGN
jgi:phage-related protein